MNRRSFIERSAVAGVAAAEAKLPAKMVQLHPDIEPLVRLLEDTPRARVLEEVASKIKQDTTYREVLAALMLAGTRSINRVPSVSNSTSCSTLKRGQETERKYEIIINRYIDHLGCRRLCSGMGEGQTGKILASSGVGES